MNRILIIFNAAILAILAAVFLTSCEAAKDYAAKSTFAVKGDGWTAGIANGGFFGVYDLTAARAAKASGKRVVSTQ